MDIHHFHPETGEYIGRSVAPLDPLETARAGQPVFLLPANATATPPPDCPEGQALVWNGQDWSPSEDHRGRTLYATATGLPVTIADLGAPCPWG